LLDGQFVGFLLLMLAVSIVFFQFHATYPKYLEEHYQLNEVLIGLLFSVNTLIIVAAEMLLLKWVRRFSLLQTIGWGGFLACLGFGLLPLGSAYWFCMLSMVVITFGEMFMFPLASGYVANRSIGRDQGSYMGWQAIMYSTAATLAPLIGTAAYQYDQHLFWYVSIFVGAAVLLGFFALDRISGLRAARESSSTLRVEN
jgi:MFS family permease